jgi:hypothetical protein
MPYPARPETLAHHFEATLIEDVYLVLHCSQCGRVIWPQGVREPASLPDLKATIAEEVA